MAWREYKRKQMDKDLDILFNSLDRVCRRLDMDLSTVDIDDLSDEEILNYYSIYNQKKRIHRLAMGMLREIAEFDNPEAFQQKKDSEND
tara:strand:- start:12969 stop:13235 length:267 start_codon:yes stop_codon:yes gene_type:complete